MKKLIIVLVILLLLALAGWRGYKTHIVPAKDVAASIIERSDIQMATITLKHLREAQKVQYTMNWDEILLDVGTPNPKRQGEMLWGKFSYQLALDGIYAHRVENNKILYSVFLDYKTGDYSIKNN